MFVKAYLRLLAFKAFLEISAVDMRKVAELGTLMQNVYPKHVLLFMEGYGDKMGSIMVQLRHIKMPVVVVHELLVCQAWDHHSCIAMRYLQCCKLKFLLLDQPTSFCS